MAVRLNEITPGLNTLESNITTQVNAQMPGIAQDIILNIQQNMTAGVDIGGVPFAPNTEATKERKRSGLVLIETTALRDSWQSEHRANEVEVFTEQEYAATMQFGARKGEFGTMSNGQPIPWGDIPARKMIPNDGEPMPSAWENIIDNRIEPLIKW